MNLKLSILFFLFVVLNRTEHLRMLLQPTYRNHHGNISLFLYISVCVCVYIYMCHVAWALIYPSAGLSASVFGDFRGCLATWICGSGGWGGYQKNHVGAAEETLERWRVCVPERLQLIRSTSCSQAGFIPTARPFSTGIICSHSSNPSLALDLTWEFCTQFSGSLLIYSYLKPELGGVWRWLCVYYVLSSEKQDPVTGVWEERKSANSPHLSAPLTDELHVAKRVYVCALNLLLHPRRISWGW